MEFKLTDEQKQIVDQVDELGKKAVSNRRRYDTSPDEPDEYNRPRGVSVKIQI